MSVRDTQFSGEVIAEGVRKAYGKQTVLDGVDLRVEAGTVHALLGPNGAGKTTMVRILSTLLPPDGGRVSVAGHDVVRQPRRVRESIGVTGQNAAVDELLTGEENLLLMSRLGRLGRSDARRRTGELLEQFDLVDARTKLVRTYSGGMRRRLDLAVSLIGRPPVIFLDEPTTRPGPAQPPGRVGHDPATWSVRGPRSCSRPSTWRRPTAWPAGSRSSITVRWWPRARPRSSSPASPPNRWSCTSPLRRTSPRAGPSWGRPTPTRASAPSRWTPTAAPTRCAAVLDRLALAAVPVSACPCVAPPWTTSSSHLTGGTRA